MNVFDENIPEIQRRLLRNKRVPVRQIGYDIGREGMQDREIIPLLIQLDRPTFFTLDSHFFLRALCHKAYCLFYLDIAEDVIAKHARRLLRHREFDSKAERMGAVIRVSPTQLTIWRIHEERERYLPWH